MPPNFILFNLDTSAIHLTATVFTKEKKKPAQLSGQNHSLCKHPEFDSLQLLGDFKVIMMLVC